MARSMHSTRHFASTSGEANGRYRVQGLTWRVGSFADAPRHRAPRSMPHWQQRKRAPSLCRRDVSSDGWLSKSWNVGNEEALTKLGQRFLVTHVPRFAQPAIAAYVSPAEARGTFPLLPMWHRARSSMPRSVSEGPHAPREPLDTIPAICFAACARKVSCGMHASRH